MQLLAVAAFTLSACATPPAPAWATRSMLSLSGRRAPEAMKPLVANSRNIFIVDGNNVRGRVGFRWTKAQLAQLLSSWGSEYGISGRVVVVWDHGLDTQALPWDGVAHVFAGPRRSADDLITDEVGRLAGQDSAERDIWLSTADRELIHRAKESASNANPAARVRVLGINKLVALLLASRPPPLLSIDCAPAQTSGTFTQHVDAFEGFGQRDVALREYATSLCKRRPHEAGRRKRRPDGFSPPFAEKTWHRVVMAEHLRLLLLRPVGSEVNEPEVGADTAPWGEGARDPSLCYCAEFGARAAAAAVERTLLDDVRLDRKQSSLLLRYGAQLAARANVQGGTAGMTEPSMPAATPVGGTLRQAMTRRERRQRRRELVCRARAVCAGAGSAATPIRPRTPTVADARRAEEALHLGAILEWIQPAFEVERLETGQPQSG
jgi:hypothetical protein